jgi:hypothetical protein
MIPNEGTAFRTGSCISLPLGRKDTACRVDVAGTSKALRATMIHFNRTGFTVWLPRLAAGTR